MRWVLRTNITATIGLCFARRVEIKRIRECSTRRRHLGRGLCLGRAMLSNQVAKTKEEVDYRRFSEPYHTAAGLMQ